MIACSGFHQVGRARIVLKVHVEMSCHVMLAAQIAILPAGRMPAAAGREGGQVEGVIGPGTAADLGAAAGAIAAGLTQIEHSHLHSAPEMVSLVSIKKLSLALKAALSEIGPVKLLNRYAESYCGNLHNVLSQNAKGDGTAVWCEGWAEIMQGEMDRANATWGLESK